MSTTNPTDADLMRLIAEFETAYHACNRAMEAFVRQKDRVAGLPDCPPDVLPQDDREAYERHCEFMERHGVTALRNEVSKLQLVSHWRDQVSLSLSFAARSTICLSSPREPIST